MLVTEITKVCSMCLTAKPHSDFYKDKKSKDGCTARCKPCAIEYAKKWSSENPGKRRAIRLRWDALHREHNTLRRRVRRAADPEAEREYNRALYAKNKQRFKAAKERWEAKNPENARTRRLNRAARVRSAAGSHSDAEWMAIVARQRGRCAHCGVTDKLERDHIMPLAKGGTNFAFNIQGLCGPCNRTKHARILVGVNSSLFDRTDFRKGQRRAWNGDL